MPDQGVGYLGPRLQITVTRREQFGRSPEQADSKNPTFNSHNAFDGTFLGLSLVARLGPFARHERTRRDQEC